MAGSGKDSDIDDWNKDGFDIKGRWDLSTISFEKSYQGRKPIYFSAKMEKDDRLNRTDYKKIQGKYSFRSNAPGVDVFYMSHISVTNSSNMPGI